MTSLQPSWPAIPWQRFQATQASLHMWSQIVGKFRLANTPWLNHSWHATLYVTARGLSTGIIPGEGQAFEVLFDFRRHVLVIDSTAGHSEEIALRPMSVAVFHAEFQEALGRLGAPTRFHGSPNEVPEAIPFAEQTAEGAYDPAAAHDFWRALVAIHQVFAEFRTGFLGKVSPPHFFWGSFDFAITRFSGETAPLHPGGFPNLPDEVTREAYSHEVSSAGFWPGGGGVEEAMFYSYAYPVPEGFKERA
ncbi:MAG: DUF5996 family protein, partial [Pseudomonadota bacterium]